MDSILNKGILTNFFEGLDTAEPMWETLATKVPSTARSEDYSWLGSIPRMRKMRGERVPNKLLEHSYTIVNEEYENSIEVLHVDIKDDQTGKYLPLARSIGESAALFPDELLFEDLVPNGFSELCYDGQFFFDSDHPVEGQPGVTQSNLETTALASGSWNTNRTKLRRMKDDFGRPVNRVLDLILMVPPELENTAKQLLEAERNADGSTNTDKGTGRVLVNPWLVDANNWYTFNVAGQVKPFIVQEREFIPFESLENDSESGFMRKKNYYGTYWRGNAGYGLYQKAIGNNVT